MTTREDALAAARVLLRFLGDDPARPGLRETPERMVRYFEEIRNGGQNIEDSATTFETARDDLVVVARIPFASLCEHHALPFWGEASVGYIPHGRLLGLSKMARAVYSASSRLSIQEEMTYQIAEMVAQWARSPDVGVRTTAVHSCMVIRGVKAYGARAAISAMLGEFRVSSALREEFRDVVREAYLL